MIPTPTPTPAASVRINITSQDDVGKLALILAVMADEADVLSEDTNLLDVLIKPNGNATPDIKVLTETKSVQHTTQLPASDCRVLMSAMAALKRKHPMIIEVQLVERTPGEDNTSQVSSSFITHEEFNNLVANPHLYPKDMEESDPVEPMD